jgi:hypothetical protein
MAPHCARCKRRNVVSYHVPEDIKRLVLLGRWKTGVCASCFDELAEQGGIRYSVEEVSAVVVRHAGAKAKRRGRR